MSIINKIYESPITKYMIICVICIVCILWYYEYDLYKYFVLRTFSKIKNGSLTIVDKNHHKIFKHSSVANISHNSDPHKTPSTWVSKIIVNNQNKFFRSLIMDGEIGIGETYVAGIWETGDIYSFAMLLLANQHHINNKISLYPTFTSKQSDNEFIKHHYDVGNDFYDTFLTDNLKAYTCGFFLCDSDTLNTAQYNKVNKIIQKLDIKEGHKILDIGYGWGAIANYIQTTTKSIVHGITISKKQVEYCNKHYPNINVSYKHYESLNGPTNRNNMSNMYDRVYVIGMLEHVRCVNYMSFFRGLSNVLKYGGRFVLHTITKIDNNTVCDSGSTQTFVIVCKTKHIFPGGQIPKHEWIVDTAQSCGFKIVNVDIFGGFHYAKTLRQWRINLMNNIPKLLKSGYGVDKIRAYEYYFVMCEASFLNNELQLSQFVFDKVDNLTNVTHPAHTCPST